MIIVQLEGGLGNQLFQYAAARCLSLHNKTNVILDLSHFTQSKKRAYGLHVFNIVADEIPILALPRNHAKYRLSRMVNRMLSIFMPKFCYFYDDILWNPVQHFFLFSDKCRLKGSFACLEYFDRCRHKLREELTLKDVYLSMPMRRLAQEMKDSNSIGVHIRRGDYVKEHQEYLYPIPISYYRRALLFLVNQINESHIYVFSDDIEWAESNLRLSGKIDYIQGNKDYEDLWLMSQCRNSVIANSTFSWWAAYLNKHRDNIVIYPERWYKDDKNNDYIKQFIPKTWVAISGDEA